MGGTWGVCISIERRGGACRRSEGHDGIGQPILYNGGIGPTILYDDGIGLEHIVQSFPAAKASDLT